MPALHWAVRVPIVTRPCRWILPRPALALLAAAAHGACGAWLVQLDTDGAAAARRPASPLLEVIPSSSGAPDPVPVWGASIVYGGMAAAAGQAIAAAAQPWAARHAAERAGGWQLLVELVRAEADAEAGRLTVEIETRVTLRGTVGQIHLGQTRGYCKVSDAFAGNGAPVVQQCLARLARDLAGWLDGISP